MISTKWYIVFIFISLSFSKYLTDYKVDTVESNFEYRNGELTNGLSSQSIVDLRILNDQSIIIGTSGGLGLLDSNMNFYSFNDDKLPNGGNPALEVYENDNLIIVSGVETVNFLNEDVSSGTGISWSTDNGASWKYMPQPQDILPVCSELTCDNPLNSPEEC